jgi:hypothetical protein
VVMWALVLMLSLVEGSPNYSSLGPSSEIGICEY